MRAEPPRGELIHWPRRPGTHNEESCTEPSVKIALGLAVADVGLLVLAYGAIPDAGRWIRAADPGKRRLGGRDHGGGEDASESDL